MAYYIIVTLTWHKCLDRLGKQSCVVITLKIYLGFAQLGALTTITWTEKHD